MKKKILVLGSNSFCGSSFTNYVLKKGFKVVGVSRSNEYHSVFLSYKNNKHISNFKFYKIDINKNLNKLIKLIKIEKFNFIVNFAAQGMVAESWKNPIDWYKTNLLSQVDMFQKIQNCKFIKKIIQFSTPEVYGDIKKPLKESFNFSPSTPYATSRASLDIHLKNLFYNYKLPIIFTRTANVFGPTQQIYRIIPKSIMCLRKKKKIFLDGGGNSIRSFIYIDDVSEALYKIVIKGKLGETYHISTNKFISIKKIVRKIEKLLNNKKKLIFNREDRIGKDHSYKLSSKKIRKSLKWKPKIHIEDGINKTINWIENNFTYLNKVDTEYKHKR